MFSSFVVSVECMSTFIVPICDFCGTFYGRGDDESFFV
jgi:hypothetical protein